MKEGKLYTNKAVFSWRNVWNIYK